MSLKSLEIVRMPHITGIKASHYFKKASHYFKKGSTPLKMNIKSLSIFENQSD
jgi:hypothetical protein